VLPGYSLPAAPSGPFPRDQLIVPRLDGGQIYLIDGRDLSAKQLVVLLGALESQETAQHFAGAPLSWLQ
jgi:hypothetical protein